MSSIEADAGSANGFLIQAVVFFPGPAHVTAAAASPGWIYCDGITMAKPRHASSNLFYPSGNLVPESEGRRIIVPVLSVAGDNCEVGVA
jgi:hypothetical protein